MKFEECTKITSFCSAGHKYRGSEDYESIIIVRIKSKTTNKELDNF